MPLLSLFPHHVFLGSVLLTLIYVTTSLVVLASIMIKGRDIWNIYRARRVETYNKTMTDLLMLALEDKAPESRPVIRAGDEALFREILLAEIKSLSGAEREYFLVLYRRMGYLRQDLDACRSPFWAQRLKALSRLNLVHELDFGKTVHEMLADPHELVSLTALKILSRDSQTFNEDTIVKILKATGRRRRHLVAEVLTNVARTRGNDILVRCLAEDSLPITVVEVVVSLINHFRVGEAVPGLTATLGKSGEVLDSDVILALQRIGDPSAADAIKPYLNHASPSLRARALTALGALQTLDATELEALAKEDTDPTFQRALQALQATVRKEAA